MQGVLQAGDGVSKTSKPTEYINLSRRTARTYGRRRQILDRRLMDLWDSMTPEEQQETSRRWKDPR